MAYEYIRSGGGDEVTMRENRLAFERLQLAPHPMVDVSDLDTRISLLGEELEAPILLAPIAYQRLFHREGERATARGASAAGTAMVISSFTSTPLETIAAETRQPIWFQLYFQRDRAHTRDMVQRAVAAGCKAVCVTVDSPVLGSRYQQRDFSLPATIQSVLLKSHQTEPFPLHQPGGPQIYEDVISPTLNWRDLDWLRSIAGVPVLLKGVLHPEDAARAVDAGAHGVIVSNHGGRNLDLVPAAIDALPRVVEAVDGKVPVLMDSGIRRGTDILMALACGARAVLIGRPYAYGLAAYGSAGVERVIRILREEFARSMALTGRCSIAEIDSSVLWHKITDHTARRKQSIQAGQ